jgi:hypothetical protein
MEGREGGEAQGVADQKKLIHPLCGDIYNYFFISQSDNIPSYLLFNLCETKETRISAEI